MDIAPGRRSVAKLKSEIVRLRCELAMERMEKEVQKSHLVLCVTNAGVSMRCCTEDGRRLPEVGLQ